MTWETADGSCRSPSVRGRHLRPGGGPGYFENRRRGLPQLFFSSLRPGSALNDIYVADAFGSAVPVNELNSTGTDGSHR